MASDESMATTSLVRKLIQMLPLFDYPILPLRFVFSMLDIPYSPAEEDRVKQLLEDKAGVFKHEDDYRFIDDGYGDKDIFLSKFGFELLCRVYKYSEPSRLSEFAKEFVCIERSNRSIIDEAKEKLEDIQ